VSSDPEAGHTLRESIDRCGIGETGQDNPDIVAVLDFFLPENSYETSHLS